VTWPDSRKVPGRPDGPESLKSDRCLDPQRSPIAFPRDIGPWTKRSKIEQAGRFLLNEDLLCDGKHPDALSEISLQSTPAPPRSTQLNPPAGWSRARRSLPNGWCENPHRRETSTPSPGPTCQSRPRRPETSHVNPADTLNLEEPRNGPEVRPARRPVTRRVVFPDVRGRPNRQHHGPVRPRNDRNAHENGDHCPAPRTRGAPVANPQPRATTTTANLSYRQDQRPDPAHPPSVDAERPVILDATVRRQPHELAVLTGDIGRMGVMR